MPTANEELLDATVRHQIVVLRFSDRMAADAAKLLEASDRELVAMLQTELTEFAEARLNAMLIEVRRLRAAAIQAVDADVHPDLDGLSQVEATWEVGAMGAAIPVELTLNTVSPATLRAVVVSPINGIPLQGWWDRLAASDAQRIEQQLRLGILQGETTDQIVRRIRGTKAAGYSDGVLAITKRDAETVVRTAANHVSTGARQATWDANADIISGVRWVATLDGRTSAVCRSRDGEVYPIDKGPRPPAHPNCRSTVVPVLAGTEIVGDRPTVRDGRTRRKRELDFAQEVRDDVGPKEWSRMSASERRAKVKAKRDAWADDNIGSTPSNVTYQDWIKRQPAKFQDEVLGPTRARLFREGGVPLDKFVDASGKQYNLDQLRTRLDDDARELLDRLRGVSDQSLSAIVRQYKAPPAGTEEQFDFMIEGKTSMNRKEFRMRNIMEISPYEDTLTLEKFKQQVADLSKLEPSYETLPISTLATIQRETAVADVRKLFISDFDWNKFKAKGVADDKTGLNHLATGLPVVVIDPVTKTPILLNGNHRAAMLALRGAVGMPVQVYRPNKLRL